MIGNVIIFKVVALIYVVLSTAEKLVLYGELVCATECIDYKQHVAQTEVIITESNCISNFLH